MWISINPDAFVSHSTNIFYRLFWFKDKSIARGNINSTELALARYIGHVRSKTSLPKTYRSLAKAVAQNNLQDIEPGLSLLLLQNNTDSLEFDSSENGDIYRQLATFVRYRC